MTTNGYRKSDANKCPPGLLKDLVAATFQLQQLEKEIDMMRLRLEQWEDGVRPGISIHAAVLSATILTQHLVKMQIATYAEIESADGKFTK